MFKFQYQPFDEKEKITRKSFRFNISDTNLKDLIELQVNNGGSLSDAINACLDLLRLLTKNKEK